MADRDVDTEDARRWTLGRLLAGRSATATSSAAESSEPWLATIGYESALPEWQRGWSGEAPEIR